MDLFPNVKLVNFIASHSDNSPILIHYDHGQQNRRNYAFRFENCWLQEERFEEIIQNGWRHGENHDIMHRIVLCAEELEKWNIFLHRNKKEELERHKDTMERCRWNHDLDSTSRFFEAQRDHNKALIREDIYWKIRAKMNWLRDGDLNTKFFHLSATARKNFQKIDMPMQEGGGEV